MGNGFGASHDRINSFAIFDTAIGRCGIAWGPRGINAVQLPMGAEEKTRGRIRQRYGDIAEAAPPAEVQRAIDGIVELLEGKPNDLSDVVLDLDGVPEFTAASTTSPARSRRARP